MLDWLDRLLDGSLVAGGAFLTIGIIGAILLLISLLLDGVFDFLEFGDGPLSLTTIAAFTTIFGFSAFGLVGAGLSSPVAGLLGALAGVLGGVLAWLLTRAIRNVESTTAVSTADLQGLEGIVVLRVPGGSGFGEIALSRSGERISLSASADHPIARGVRVLIVTTLTPTSVLVAEVTEQPNDSTETA